MEGCGQPGNTRVDVTWSAFCPVNFAVALSRDVGLLAAYKEVPAVIKYFICLRVM